jgi:hypothetical protein
MRENLTVQIVWGSYPDEQAFIGGGLTKPLPAKTTDLGPVFRPVGLFSPDGCSGICAAPSVGLSVSFIPKAMGRQHELRNLCVTKPMPAINSQRSSGAWRTNINSCLVSVQRRIRQWRITQAGCSCAGPKRASATDQKADRLNVRSHGIQHAPYHCPKARQAQPSQGSGSSVDR